MAGKGKRIVVRLLSSANTGFFYTTTRNPSSTTKLRLRKYDPIVRQHVYFDETKMPSGKKR